MKVAVFSTKKFEKDYLLKSNNNKHQLVFIEKALSTDTAGLAEGCEGVSIFTNDDASGKVIAKLHQLGVKYIATRAAGFDNIDLKQATESDMRVGNVPEYSPYSIAEHTVGMMLAMNRKLIRADRKVKDHNFSLDDLIGFDLHGKTVGIVGTGRIGSIVAKILHGFGCKLLGYDIQPKADLVKNYNMHYVKPEDLFKNSDIITLNAPLNSSTRYMINKDTLDIMKKGVMIVNTGRGGLVNTADAINGLKEGKIGYLGLDVYENEKGLFFYDHSQDIPQDDMFARLLTFKNVLITGHQAFLTENALQNIADTTIYNITCWGEGKETKNDLIRKENVHQI